MIKSNYKDLKTGQPVSQKLNDLTDLDGNNGESATQFTDKQDVSDVLDSKTGSSSQPSEGSNIETQDEQSKDNDTSFDIEQVPTAFPYEIFPSSIGTALDEIGFSLNTSREIASMALLGVSGMLIGRSRAIEMKAGWKEHPNLYIAIIAKSGIGKSPAVDVIMKPVWDLDCEYKPVVDDITLEGFRRVFQKNPKGILWYSDELAGIFQNMDKFTGGQGATQSRLESWYDSNSWTVNRVNEDSDVFIKKASLSIMGTIQPEAVSKYFTIEILNTGFVPRVLFAHIEQNKLSLWTDKEISNKTNELLRKLIQSLHDLQFDDENNPIILKLDNEASDLYKAWFDFILLKADKSSQSNYKMSIAKKLHAQCLRLALIIHYLNNIDREDCDSMEINKDTISKAILLSNYLERQKMDVIERFILKNRDPKNTVKNKLYITIISLESEIDSSMLSTSRITDEYNKGCDIKYQLSTKQIGSHLKELGFEGRKMKDGSSRGIIVMEDDIIMCRKLTNGEDL